MLAFLLIVIRIVLQTIQRLVYVPMIAINALYPTSIKTFLASGIFLGKLKLGARRRVLVQRDQNARRFSCSSIGSFAAVCGIILGVLAD